MLFSCFYTHKGAKIQKVSEKYNGAKYVCSGLDEKVGLVSENGYPA